VLWQAPAQLLGNFEAVGLGAFRVIGPQIDVDDGPAVFVGDLCAEAIDVIVVAAYAHHRGAEDQRAEDLPLLQIVGDHHIAAKARLGGVGSGAVGKVSRAGATDRVESKFDRLADGDGDNALLVGIRGIVTRIILDP
jgi:hypothetical protein